MLNTLRGSIYVNPLVAALPGVMIFMTSMSFNLLSDGLARCHGRAAVADHLYPLERGQTPSDMFGAAMAQHDTILTVQDLRKYFAVRGGLFHTVQAEVKAVDGVSFDVQRGEILGIVGESRSSEIDHGSPAAAPHRAGCWGGVLRRPEHSRSSWSPPG